MTKERLATYLWFMLSLSHLWLAFENNFCKKCRFRLDDIINTATDWLHPPFCKQTSQKSISDAWIGPSFSKLWVKGLQLNACKTQSHNHCKAVTNRRAIQTEYTVTNGDLHLEWTKHTFNVTICLPPINKSTNEKSVSE